MYITIFKTSVVDKNALFGIGPELDAYLSVGNWSFAFEDTDKILRVVSASPCTQQVKHILENYGFFCEELPYSLDEFKV
ncbi:hypothetical protein [Pedobacter nutrimenti]|nr:hypothetical protein [Pedobacter nutrimenti]